VIPLHQDHKFQADHGSGSVIVKCRHYQRKGDAVEQHCFAAELLCES